MGSCIKVTKRGGSPNLPEWRCGRAWVSRLVSVGSTGSIDPACMELGGVWSDGGASSENWDIFSHIEARKYGYILVIYVRSTC